MEMENAPSTPVGIVLIATFWIFVGTWLLSITSGLISNSSYYNLFALIPFFISIGLILLGWGLLTLQKWAFYIALILSLLGLLPLVFIFIGEVSWLLSMNSYRYGLDFYTSIRAIFEISFFILFVLMSCYLFKKLGSLKKDNELLIIS
ncbi:MAG: hypothetical protein IMZ43_00160 [Thermoplasmata archaeon]|nr:hypothetical protein [Thermoplasmata archaeon]